MKFGESMADEMVPEWRAQYLDYAAGKKHIKKLKKQRSAIELAKSKTISDRDLEDDSEADEGAELGGNKHYGATKSSPMDAVRRTFTGTSKMPPPPSPQPETGSSSVRKSSQTSLSQESPARSISSIRKTPKTLIMADAPTVIETAADETPDTPKPPSTPYGIGLSSGTPGGSNSSKGTPKDRMRRVTFSSDTPFGSFSLPSPAINVPSSSINKSGVSLSSTEEVDPNTEYSPTVEIGPTSPLIDGTNSSGVSQRNSKTLHRRKSTMGKLFDNIRRQNSLSQLFNSPTNLTATSQHELDDLSKEAKSDFLGWVDVQLEKVDSFYKEKEEDCLERFLILQDQMVQLEDQKAHAKRELERAKEQAQADVNPRQKMLAKRKISVFSRAQLHPHQPGDSDDEDADDDDEFYDINGVDIERHMSHSSNDNDVPGANFYLVDGARHELRIATFWIKRQMRIFSKFDLPSLPTWDWLKHNGQAEKQYYEEGYWEDTENDLENKLPNAELPAANTGNVYGQKLNAPGQGTANSSTASLASGQRDYSRKHTHTNKPKARTVPYFIARRMLKRAVYEFYKSILLLRSYRLQNRTAFRKIIKKYDKTMDDTLLPTYMKKVDSQYFVTSDVLDNLQSKVEDMVTMHFENGNRKIAVSKLRSTEAKRLYYWATWFDGQFFGLGIPILAFTIYWAVHRTDTGDLPEGKWLMQIWAGFLLLCCMAMLFGVNCLVWNLYKINYKLIFEFSPRDNLDFRQYLVLPMLIFFIGTVIGWFSFMDFWTVEFNGRDWPWLFLVISVCIIFCPFDIFFLNARIWFLSTLVRLALSGFYPIEFRDFFMGDIFCSLTYSFSNLSMFFCLYGTHWDKCIEGKGGTPCGSSKSRTIGFLSALPNIWRFLQCFRRFADTGDGFPHVLNMGKYFLACMYQMSLSLYRIEKKPLHKGLLITFGALNGNVSAAWDLLMDWSLFQFNSKNFLLRDELTYKRKWVYYAAMVLDVILRNQWMAYVFPNSDIQQSAIISFGVAIAELLRRFNWIFFRMENEHATNVHLFRASRDSPLPFPSANKRVRLVARPMPSPASARITHPDVESQVPESASEGHVGSGAQAQIKSYWSDLSTLLKMAHIKDFQRRRPSADVKNRAAVAEEVMEEVDDIDRPDVIPEEDEGEEEDVHGTDANHA